MTEDVDYRELCTQSGTKPKGGRPTKDYLLTQDAARRVVATDNSPRGRALLRALLDLADRVEAGDPEVAAFVNRRHREVHGTAAPGAPDFPWSRRLENWYWTHVRLATHLGLTNEKVGPGCWTILVAIVGPMLKMEDELLRHALPIDLTDRPDGSVGKCWANYRRSLSTPLPEVETTVELKVPLSGGRVRTTHPNVYPATERALFDHWLVTRYLPEKLPSYLHTKYAGDFGRLPPASAADHVNLILRGERATLPVAVRSALVERGGYVPALPDRQSTFFNLN